MSTTEAEPTVPQILRAAREAAGHTQRELAAMLGVSQQAITGWETGTRNLSGTDMLRFLKACGVQTTLRRESGSPIRYKSSTSFAPMGISRLPDVTADTHQLVAA